MSQIMDNQVYEDEIDLKTLIKTLWSFRVFIIRITLVFGLLGLLFSGVSYVLSDAKTMYTAEAIVEINTDGSAKLQREAYISLLTSQINVTNAIKDLELTQEFNSQDITVTEQESKRFINVMVSYPNLEQVTTIADAIVSQSIIQGNNVLKGVLVSTKERSEVINQATATKEAPNFILNIVIALVLGGMFSVFIVFFMEYLTNKVKTVEDVEHGLSIEVLATLPNMQEENKKEWWPW